MIKHQITKYFTDGKQYATAWIQINIFGKIFTFSKKTIEITNNVNVETLNISAEDANEFIKELRKISTTTVAL